MGVTADVPRHTRHVLRLDGDRVVPLNTGCVLADVCLTKGYCWGLVEVCVPLSALIKKNASQTWLSTCSAEQIGLIGAFLI